MRNVIAASSVRHAQAMIRWCKLDKAVWRPVAYGDTLDEMFLHARIVRPLGGMTKPHFDWMLEMLVPHVAKRIEPMPAYWSLQPEESEAVSRYTRDLIWA